MHFKGYRPVSYSRIAVYAAGRKWYHYNVTDALRKGKRKMTHAYDKKFIRTTLTFLALVFSILLATPRPAKALSAPITALLIEDESNLLSFSGKSGTFCCVPVQAERLSNWNEYRVAEAKCDDPSVRVKINGNIVNLTVKKSGTATLSVTYEIGKKRFLASFDLEFYRYKNAFSKVKVDGKVRKYRTSKPGGYYAKVFGKKAKVTVQLTQGWKIKKIKAWYVSKDGSRKKIKGSFRNGSSFPVKSSATTMVSISAWNPKANVIRQKNVYLTKATKKSAR